MTPWTLARRGLRHFRRTHAGVLAGVALTSALLVASLAVGDSVDGSLRALSDTRLGGVQSSLVARGRWLRAELAPELAAALGRPVAPVLQLDATASTPDGSVRLGGLRLLGIDDRFLALGSDVIGPALTPGTARLSPAVARRLGLAEGESLLFRMAVPDPLPGDTPMALDGTRTLALRVTVAGPNLGAGFDRFSLAPEPEDPPNVFVPLQWLQQEAGLEGRASMLLVGGPGPPPGAGPEAGTAVADAAQAELARHWDLADAGLSLSEVAVPSGEPTIELSSARILLEPPVVEVATRAVPGATRVATWLANELSLGERTTPYFFVSALDPPSSPLPAEALGPGEVALDRWLADDLGAAVGQTVRLVTYAFEGGRSVREQTRELKVAQILPMEGAAIDPTLMPRFPGFEDAPRCRDWEPGIPIHTERIRETDEDYWARWRGAPKAFVSIETARSLWETRFGLLTALRLPPDAAPELRQRLRAELDPAQLGLSFRPTGREAIRPASDFAELFIGFGFFLIASALLLTALLFGLGVMQRAPELRALSALGLPPRRIRGLALREGLVLATLGAAAGLPLGLLLTEAVLAGLTGAWSGALSHLPLRFAVAPASLLIAAVLAVLTSLGAMSLALRRAVGQALGPLTESRSPGTGCRDTVGAWLAGSAGLTALVLVLRAGQSRDAAAALVFFAAGGLLLLAGAGLAHALLTRVGSVRRPTNGRSGLGGLGGLALRNLGRQRARGVAVITLLATGTFLIVGVGANRHDPLRHAEQRDSGTGGFALWAESTSPVRVDLDTEAGLEAFALTRDELQGARVVSLRVRDGDDASCLSPAQARVPTLVGVRPDALASRGAFRFTHHAPLPISHASAPEPASPWTLLDAPRDDGAIPVIGDEGTIVWALHLGLGDTLEVPDERGQPRRLLIVGITTTSLLQGALVMSDRHFGEFYPTEAGYRRFLIDVAPDVAAPTARALENALADQGLVATPGFERLALFRQVENTYLAIFLALGALGLALGALGTGVLLARNVLERRHELALLSATGFSAGRLRRLVLLEHTGLLVVGVTIGTCSALVAVLPALRSPGQPFPTVPLAIALSLVLLAGLVSTAIATRVAVGGPLIAALRDE